MGGCLTSRARARAGALGHERAILPYRVGGDGLVARGRPNSPKARTRRVLGHLRRHAEGRVAVVSDRMRPERPLEERLTLRVGEVATLLGVPERTVYRWVSDGHLPVVRVGRVTLVPRLGLQEWIERETKRAW